MSDSDDQSPSPVERAAVAVAAELRAARARKGLKQSELAELAGMDSKTIHRLETGKSNMSIPQLYALAQALGTTAADMLDAAQAVMDKQAPGRDA